MRFNLYERCSYDTLHLRSLKWHDSQTPMDTTIAYVVQRSRHAAASSSDDLTSGRSCIVNGSMNEVLCPIIRHGSVQFSSMTILWPLPVAKKRRASS